MEAFFRSLYSKTAKVGLAIVGGVGTAAVLNKLDKNRDNRCLKDPKRPECAMRYSKDYPIYKGVADKPAGEMKY